MKEEKKVEDEVCKVRKTNFIKEIKYLLWLKNYVLIKKKAKEKWITSVDFPNLNLACPEDLYIQTSFQEAMHIDLVDKKLTHSLNIYCNKRRKNHSKVVLNTLKVR